MKKILLMVVGVCLLCSLSGCLYPDQERAENKVPYKDQMRSVQEAVQAFQKDQSVLPIKNKDMTVDVYEKYPLDFSKLAPKYMSEPPGNSFEKGGTFQYVLVNPETKPTVKLIDLIAVNRAQTLQERLKQYMQDHKYPPFKKILATGRYTLDYKKMGYKEEPYVVSPYTQRNLPFIIDDQLHVFIDYSMDLYSALKKEKKGVKAGRDIRALLVKHSFFVPARSVPYGVQKGEPVFLQQKPRK
ncbi:hypothetical protein A374_03384 [Fictibacillus macauensis ZFHKF-1]|uniref:Lipoprotein n=1 Tax=Fictibacillus macauensis ZFHKF-1 TaxID=1196324 RepID=I8J485_9BACL|nr:hypothetical protein [Fictibacillus macauensis]EIT86581.1 hypothetical protein A374_03384 [Fictibacillus macauensis ZFHKF-1]